MFDFPEATLGVNGMGSEMSQQAGTSLDCRARMQVIIEVEGYDGESGSIIVTKQRADSPTSLGALDRIHCIGEGDDGGIVRFLDWGLRDRRGGQRGIEKHPEAPHRLTGRHHPIRATY